MECHSDSLEAGARYRGGDIEGTGFGEVVESLSLGVFKLSLGMWFSG